MATHTHIIIIIIVIIIPILIDIAIDIDTACENAVDGSHGRWWFCMAEIPTQHIAIVVSLLLLPEARGWGGGREPML